jgi:hypothetical protein
MPRIRTVKPSHWSDKELPNISLQAHLLWIATWNFSDDDGVFEADALFLKSQIFPRRTDIRVDQIQSWLDQLVKARFILPFLYKGERYYVSRTFRTHQKIDRPHPGIIPPEELVRVFDERSTNDRRTIDASIVEDSSVEEGSGGGNEPPPQPTPEEIEFRQICKWLKEKAPRVLQMKEPLTMENYFKLKARYGVELIPKIFLAMHNWSPLTKERVNPYLTFIAFAKREAA